MFEFCANYRQFNMHIKFYTVIIIRIDIIRVECNFYKYKIKQYNVQHQVYIYIYIQVPRTSRTGSA